MLSRPEAIRDCPHIGPGPYAISAHDGRKICDECAAAIDRHEIHNGRPIVAYLSSTVERPEGFPYMARQAITTWPGVVLGYLYRDHCFTLPRTLLPTTKRYTPSGGVYDWGSARVTLYGRECSVSGQGNDMCLRIRPLKQKGS